MKCKVEIPTIKLVPRDDRPISPMKEEAVGMLRVETPEGFDDQIFDLVFLGFRNEPGILVRVRELREALNRVCPPSKSVG